VKAHWGRGNFHECGILSPSTFDQGNAKAREKEQRAARYREEHSFGQDLAQNGERVAERGADGDSLRGESLGEERLATLAQQ